MPRPRPFELDPVAQALKALHEVALHERGGSVVEVRRAEIAVVGVAGQHVVGR